MLIKLYWHLPTGKIATLKTHFWENSNFENTILLFEQNAFFKINFRKILYKWANHSLYLLKVNFSFSWSNKYRNEFCTEPKNTWFFSERTWIQDYTMHEREQRIIDCSWINAGYIWEDENTGSTVTVTVKSFIILSETIHLLIVVQLTWSRIAQVKLHEEKRNIFHAGFRENIGKLDGIQVILLIISQ